MSVYIIIFVLTIFFIIYEYLKKKYSYWSSKGIKGPEPTPIVGNFGGVMLDQESLDQILKKAYNQFPNEKVVGLYRGLEPVILIRDPELIKQVLIKDFPCFQDRGINTVINRLSQNLFALEGDSWRILRQKLTPIFTSSKLRNMMPLIQACADNYVRYINKLVDKNVDHEIRLLTGKYTSEVLVSCAFGINLNSLGDEETEFSLIVKRAVSLTNKTKFWITLEMLIPSVGKLFPNLSNSNKKIEDFFITLVKTIVKDRQGKPKTRKDFMDFMIELRERGKVTRSTEDGDVKFVIDDTVMAAQALIFYFAGLETTSAQMSFLIHELALNQDIQEKAYKEVCEVYKKYNDQLTYDSLQELIYLDMLLDATLRKYPVSGAIMRKAVVNYRFPDTEIRIKKNTKVFISVSGLHHDPKYFPNPEKFDPDVFSPENKSNTSLNVFLPFGEGPRNCIGMRFAKVQSLMGMAVFIKNFKVEPSAKTKKVLDFENKDLILTPKGGIWVKTSKR